MVRFRRRLKEKIELRRFTRLDAESGCVKSTVSRSSEDHFINRKF